MYTRTGRICRWIMLATSGAFLLQAAGCNFLPWLQTGLLGALTGGMFYLIKSV